MRSKQEFVLIKEDIVRSNNSVSVKVKKLVVVVIVDKAQEYPIMCYLLEFSTVQRFLYQYLRSTPKNSSILDIGFSFIPNLIRRNLEITRCLANSAVV